MVRKNIYLTKEQVKELESLGGLLSEHIRRAIDEYIDKIKKSNVSSSAS